MTRYEIGSHIMFRGDGPVTPFVALCRALELAQKGENVQTVADALTEEHPVLAEVDWNDDSVTSNEFGSPSD